MHTDNATESTPSSLIRASDGQWSDSFLKGILLYCATNVLALLGVYAGVDWIPLCWNHPDATGIHVETVSGYFAPWDGVWYRRIVQDGYTYDPHAMSTVAFFPLYPTSCWVVKTITGLHIEYAMLLTSHLYLAAAFVVFVEYLKGRTPELSSREQTQTLLAFALFPTTFYWRMSYTESSFLLTALLAMLGMQRNWRPIWIALLVGLVTSSRTVGVSLLLPFGWHLWSESRSWGRFVGRAVWLLPVACWGLIGYMAFQWVKFDDPLAFVRTQAHWQEWNVPKEWWRKAWAYLSLEPFWQVYLSDCPCYWGNDPPQGKPYINMQFANPFFVMFTWLVVGYGVRRQLLTTREGLMSLGLLAIPYITHSYRCCMASEGRYAAVVFPFYIMLGHWLSRCPAAVSGLIYVVSAVYLGICSAMFVSWYWFY